MRAQHRAAALVLGGLGHVRQVRQRAGQQRGAFHVALLFKCLLRVTAKGVPTAVIVVGVARHAQQPQQPRHRRLLIRASGQQMVARGPRRIIARAQIAHGDIHLQLRRIV